MNDNGFEKLFSLVLENWLSLTLIVNDAGNEADVRFGAECALDVLNDILSECGYLPEATDFYLERQQVRIESILSAAE